MTAYGIYASGKHTRLCGITDQGDVNFLERYTEDQDLSHKAWVHDGEKLAKRVCAHLPRRDMPVYLAVPCGIYQIRRVPLEVAEEVDRLSQVRWEVQQALCASEGEYSVDYVASGSSAIWVAIPTVCVDRLSKAFENEGVKLFGLTAEPIALAKALRRQNTGDHSRAIFSGPEWIATVEIQNGTLVSATTQNTPSYRDNGWESKPESWRDLVRKRIEESSVPTYIVGEEEHLAGFLSEVNAPQPLLVNETEGALPPDTLLSIAYGAALSGIDKDLL
ncbi:MAG: hypothetical protein VX910_11420 [Candidatus Latescibacterota bacterium]|nr:hypothetical protein [Candidatus Latescibacterota bacterium]